MLGLQRQNFNHIKEVRDEWRIMHVVGMVYLTSIKIPVFEDLSQRYDYGCHHFCLQREETRKET